jgi:uncharacterized membrane protein YesL
MKKFFLRLGIILLVNIPLFYMFEENKACVIEFGTRCSTFFIVKILVQAIVLSVIFHLSDRKRSKEENRG